MPTRLRFWKACPELTQKEVPHQTVMIAKGRQVTLRTFISHVGRTEINEWAATHGFERDRRHGPTLETDPFIGYFLSTWDGEPCAYLVWSAQEHIWRLR